MGSGVYPGGVRPGGVCPGVCLQMRLPWSWGASPLRRTVSLTLLSTLLLANLFFYLARPFSIRPDVLSSVNTSGSAGRSCRTPHEATEVEATGNISLALNLTENEASGNTSGSVERAWRSPDEVTEVEVTEVEVTRVEVTANNTLPPSLMETERRIRERVKLLRETCNGLKKASQVKENTLDVLVKARTELLEDHKVIVCQVLKAGSTAWNYLLAHRYNMTDLIENKLFYKVLEVLKPTLKRFREATRSREFLKFLVVRDPLERLLSAYRDRILDTSHVSWQAHHFVPLILVKTRGISYAHSDLYNIDGSVKVVPSFSEFLNFIVDEEPQDFDPHWMPVSQSCAPCHIKYTDVVHTETFLDDIQYIMRKSGLDTKVNASLLMQNTNKGRGNTQDLLTNQYRAVGPELFQRIVQKYKLDFVLFGYDPNRLFQHIWPNSTFNWKD
ncbi:carbohydrate sulfotransferase 10 isoform X1 [Procambarus clarkii]|uniref:carbohydrate sulfotransferase 10 isoform X1 n=1 Tax=Procambarus clarkii TaxID=6728 RepID=UPI00374400AD